MIVSLARMRLFSFVRTGRAMAPFLGVLVMLGVIYGGGPAQPGEAYGFSAAILFPILAWQTKILLDVEPDVQRRLTVVAIGGLRSEIVAGILAALATGVVLVLLTLVVPWMIGGITGPHEAGDPPLADGVIAGVWANLLLLPPALALGALASRAAVGTAARGVAVLAGGAVVGFAFGVRDSPVAWLAPPLIPTSRSTVDGLAVGSMLGYTAQALVWAVLVLVGYVMLRRRND